MSHLISLYEGIQESAEEVQSSASSLRHQQLVCADLQSSGLQQQVTGLLEVLQHTGKQDDCPRVRLESDFWTFEDGKKKKANSA